jgi:uncharacterized LabA/DUF88 family protein
MRVAVLVDAAFFLRRYWKLVPNGKDHDGQQVAAALHCWACDHTEFNAMGSKTRESRRLRKVALRLGQVSDVRHWAIKAEAMQDIVKGKRMHDTLGPDDVQLDVKQKGVDMRIGVDVASRAYKKLVDRIVLVAGDADFVPAAKLARREGIDFVLDSMHAHINDALYEHIDGLVSMAPPPTAAAGHAQPAKPYPVNYSSGVPAGSPEV